jgi:hypothetical protein
LLFIELIQPRAEDEDETENENDHENGDENENDENESKQYRDRLSVSTKTDDAKCKNAVNRLHFMKLKKLKNISFEKESFFRFRDANSISSVAYFDRGKRESKRGFLSDSTSECQPNRRVMSRYSGDNVKVFVSDVRI